MQEVGRVVPEFKHRSATARVWRKRRMRSQVYDVEEVEEDENVLEVGGGDKGCRQQEGT